MSRKLDVAFTAYLLVSMVTTLMPVMSAAPTPIPPRLRQRDTWTHLHTNSGKHFTRTVTSVTNSSYETVLSGEGQYGGILSFYWYQSTKRIGWIEISPSFHMRETWTKDLCLVH